VRTRIRILLLLPVLAAGLLVAGLAAPAHAVLGFRFPGGSTACTDQARSDRGVRIYGRIFSTAGTWTVRASTTAGGPETEIFRTVQEILPTTTVRPPAAGVFFLRACVSNTGSGVGQYRLNMGVGPAGIAEDDIGPHVAVLGPGGEACGEFAWTAERLVGSSNVAVQWLARFVNVDDLSGSMVPVATAARVDRVLPGPGENEWLEACVRNTSATTATVAFDLSPA
jgi:hypothetical protein